ncbi:MAG: helix-turn-helix domain-containing protein [Solirubrobacteraceae bacterium]
MSRTEDNFHSVKALAEMGLSDYQIAARTGVNRSTVQRWRHRDHPPYARLGVSDADAWRVEEPAAYCYLLGCYLGDGHVTHRPPGTWALRIACDQLYRHIIDEIMAALAATFPGRRPTRFASSSGASDVVAICHPAVGAAFPQHGPGRKHLRPIVLTDWQLRLTHAHPGALIRGLIHSDGCRVLNRFKTKLPSGRVAEYSYVRYFFSNLSEDIRRIFADHCGLLDIRVTQSNHRNLTVSHRDSVAVLEELVGPKT